MLSKVVVKFPGELPAPMVMDLENTDDVRPGTVFRVAGQDMANWQEVECVEICKWWSVRGYSVKRTQLEVARIKLEMGDALIRDAENIINAEFNRVRNDKHALLTLARRLPACNTKRFVIARLRELGFCGPTVYDSGPWIGETQHADLDKATTKP